VELDAVLGLAPQMADALGIHLLDDELHQGGQPRAHGREPAGGRRFSCGGPVARRTSAATRAAWSNDHQWELTCGG
jgi:hypothetical protein